MFKRLRPFLSLALALALPLLPLWHSWAHAEEDSHATRSVCTEQGRGQQHWHQASAAADDCELCQALSQQSLGSAQAPALVATTVSAQAQAPALRAPVSFEFLYFDHRGPPAPLAV